MNIRGNNPTEDAYYGTYQLSLLVAANSIHVIPLTRNEASSGCSGSQGARMYLPTNVSEATHKTLFRASGQTVP